MCLSLGFCRGLAVLSSFLVGVSERIFTPSPRLFTVFARGAIQERSFSLASQQDGRTTRRRWSREGRTAALRSNSQMASSSITGRVIASQGVIALGVGAWLIRRNQEEGKAGEGASQAPLNARKVLRAANSIVKSARSYGFVCTNWHGDSAPECRIMDTHWLNRDQALDLSLVTRSFARKAETLRKNPECSVCYHDPRASGENGCMLLVRRRSLDPTLASPFRPPSTNLRIPLACDRFSIERHGSRSSSVLRGAASHLEGPLVIFSPVAAARGGCRLAFCAASSGAGEP